MVPERTVLDVFKVGVVVGLVDEAGHCVDMGQPRLAICCRQPGGGGDVLEEKGAQVCWSVGAADCCLETTKEKHHVLDARSETLIILRR
jgi:hypothetical protein